MAVTSQIAFQGFVYTVVEDVTTRYRAVLVGRVLEAVTGDLIRAGLSVRTERTDLTVKLPGDGLFCVSGTTERVFPDLPLTAYQVDLVVTAPGHEDASVSVPIPANALFPITVPDVALDPSPVSLQGRVTSAVGAGLPIPGARVRITDAPTPPAPVNHPAGLRTATRFAHGAGVVVRPRTPSASGPARQLVAEVRAGSSAMVVSDRTGLGAGDVIAVGPDLLLEYVAIVAVSTDPPNLAMPGEIAIRGLFVRSFPTGSPVQRVLLGPPGPAMTLSAPAPAGTGLVVLSGQTTAQMVEIVDPVPTEVEQVTLGALTDGQGYYRMDGLRGVVEAGVVASAAGFTPMPQPMRWTVDYGRPSNVMDMTLRP